MQTKKVKKKKKIILVPKSRVDLSLPMLNVTTYFELILMPRETMDYWKHEK